MFKKKKKKVVREQLCTSCLYVAILPGSLGVPEVGYNPVGCIIEQLGGVLPNLRTASVFSLLSYGISLAQSG